MRVISLRIGLAGASLLLLTGCADPANQGALMMFPAAKADSGADEYVESNIVRVNKFFNANPWLVFDNTGADKIDGMRFSVYLEGPNRPGGVFGTGTLIVTLYQLDRDRTGREQARQVHEWVLPSERAYAFRAKKRTLLGWGYGLRLHWDNSLSLEGKQIAVLVKYVRDDGKTITSSRQVLKVPIEQSAGLAAG